MEPNQENTAEERFRQENGMTIDEAWEKVREWNLSGKREETRRGCKIILEFFPEHEAKNLLERLDGEGTSEKEQPSKKQSIVEKIAAKFTDGVAGFLQKKKKKEVPRHEKKFLATEASHETIPEEKTVPPQSISPDRENKTEGREPPPREPSLPEKHETAQMESTESDPAVPKKPEEEPPGNETLLDEERIFATISYAWVFCLIPLLMKKDSNFVQFHAKQGLVMAIFLTVFEFTVGFVLNSISSGLGFLLKIIYLAILLYAAYSAYRGKYWKIPFIYGISTKIKL